MGRLGHPTELGPHVLARRIGEERAAEERKAPLAIVRPRLDERGGLAEDVDPRPGIRGDGETRLEEPEDRTPLVRLAEGPEEDRQRRGPLGARRHDRLKSAPRGRVARIDRKRPFVRFDRRLRGGEVLAVHVAELGEEIRARASSRPRRRGATRGSRRGRSIAPRRAEGRRARACSRRWVRSPPRLRARRRSLRRSHPARAAGSPRRGRDRSVAARRTPCSGRGGRAPR